MVRTIPVKRETSRAHGSGAGAIKNGRDDKRTRFLEDAKSSAASMELDKELYSREMMDGFVSTVLSKVEERYIQQHSGTHLIGQLRDSLRFLQARKAKQTKVRVFRPEQKEHGYELQGMVLETALKDQPFVFDTIRMFLSANRIRVRNSMNVVLSVERGGNGQLQRILGGVEEREGTQESYCRFYTDLPEDMALADIQAGVEESLALAQAVVKDFGRMTKVTMDLRTEYKLLRKIFQGHRPYLDEAQQFLEWLEDGNFVFMGVTHYGVGEAGVCVSDGSLGVMKLGDWTHRPEVGDEETLHMLRLNRPIDRYFLQVRKNPSESRIHRSGKMDEVVVRRFDLDGRPTGGVVLHGLFTYKAISSPGGTIPILQKKVNDILESERAVPNSYEYKSIVDAFNSLPVEYLFTAMTAEITRLLESLIRAEREQSVQYHLDVDGDARSAFFFVAIPQQSYNDDMRSRLQEFMTGALDATYCDHRVFIGKTESVIVHLYLTGANLVRTTKESELEEDILSICSSWEERLEQALGRVHDKETVQSRLGKYSRGFSKGYKAIRSVEQAVVDIEFAERVAETGELGFDLTWEDDATAQLVLYEPQNIFLTDILPILDHFGLRVREQEAFTLRIANPVVIDSFFVEGESLPTARSEEGKQRLLEALGAVFSHKVADDPLNRLVSVTEMSWQEVDVVRGYLGYSRQLLPLYTPEVVRQVLLDQPHFAELLASVFRVKFNPELELSKKARQEAFSALSKEYEDALREVTSLSRDRVLKMLFNLIDSTLRTNFYRDDKVAHYISFKLECAAVHEMTDPRPWREIYVHHVDMEGIHMRGGAVARGGIRWSDRPDDYRSEVLGLMTTQMVKNTLIVPVGAKGGFVLKNSPADGNVRAFADSMYTFFIRGLLDMTDNRAGGKVIVPPRVVRHDGDDPYLVVAADKGTAHLSDTANSISEEYKFWLGDAFGSGGSTGYDHKVEGITAKGAWVCTRRHFYEMDMDPEKDAVRVAGIGDMSGDVFGNGMLLSKSMKVCAAFNHRNIFLDPDPDPKQSYKERVRLFKLPRSSWEDYKPALISEGGGVFSRQSKEIRLSEPVKEMLGTDVDVLSGEALIRQILCMDVDLLWNGGIGTYLKSAEETHVDVSDKANDAVRIDPHELNASVFGEGGNLGATQSGRVAYNLLGGRINTDAVDNAGGVNLSDREVNLKVLFSPLMRAGKLSMDARNEVLRAATQEVVDKVTVDNELQSLRISLDRIRSDADLDVFARCQKRLVESGILNAEHESLPGRLELKKRRKDGTGYTRPELAVLGAYVKMSVFEALLESDLGDPVWDRELLEDYFPTVVYERFADAAEGHMLRHEILCTIKTNLIVDYAGSSFFTEMTERTDRSLADVGFAYLAAHSILGAWRVKQDLLALQGKRPCGGVYQALMFLETIVRRTVVWILNRYPAEEISGLSAGICGELAELLTGVMDTPVAQLGSDINKSMTQAVKGMTKAGVPKPMAERLVRMSHAGDQLYPLRGTRVNPAPKALAKDWLLGVHIWDALDSSFGFRAIEERLMGRSSVDKWEAIALLGLANLFSEVHCELAAKVLSQKHLATVKERRKGVVKLVKSRSDLTYLSRYLKEASQESPSVPKLLVLGDRLKTAARQLVVGS